MSTSYAPLEKIRSDDVFDGRLESRNIHEHVVPGQTTGSSRCLTDGEYYLWVHIDAHGFVDQIVRHGLNAPGFILGAIAEIFDIKIVSEHQPEFWGYATNEEWETALDKIRYMNITSESLRSTS